MIQYLRYDAKVYSLETLFSNLLDKSKRFSIRDKAKKAKKAYNIVLKPYKVFKRPKKAYKAIKGKYYTYYKLPGHKVKGCYFLFPNKAPQG
jgi:hypothetical protein